MLHLIRVYRDDQIQPIHVEVFEKGDVPPLEAPPHKGCRCHRSVSWNDYYNYLALKYQLGKKLSQYYQHYTHGHVSMEPIYPSSQKRRDT